MYTVLLVLLIELLVHFPILILPVLWVGSGYVGWMYGLENETDMEADDVGELLFIIAVTILVPPFILFAFIQDYGYPKSWGFLNPFRQLTFRSPVIRKNHE